MLILQTLLYVLSVTLLVVAAHKVQSLSQMLDIPVLIAVCIYCGVVLYLAMVIPAFLGILNPYTATFVLLGISLLTIWYLDKQYPSFGSQDTEANNTDNKQPLFQEPWNGGAIALIFLGIYWCWPLLDYLSSSLTRLFSPDYPLNIDTVVYHIPGLVDILQHQLWTLDGSPFQSYSFGFELIAGFPMLFFSSHWGFLAANLYAGVFFIAALILVTSALIRPIVSANIPLHAPGASIATIGISTILFGQFTAMGKNDVFMGACVLASFGLLLDARHYQTISSHKEKSRAIVMFLLAAAALGLGAATKPTTLLYIPFFLLMTISFRGIAKEMQSVKEILLLRIIQTGIFFLIVLVLASPFLLRNIFMLGSLQPPERIYEAGMLRSIASFATQRPETFQEALPGIVHGQKYLLYIPLVPFFIGYIILSLRIKQKLSPAWLWFLLFYLVALGIFLFTPFVLSTGGGLKVGYRLGLPLFGAIAITLAIILALMVAAFPSSRLGFMIFNQRQQPNIQSLQSRKPYEHGRIPLIPVILVLLFMLIPWYWHWNRTPGFFGLDGRVLKTSIWIEEQTEKEPARIIFVNTGDVGCSFFGRTFQNPVTSAGAWLYEADVFFQMELLSAIHRFQQTDEPVEMVVVSNQKTGILAWMQNQGFFEQVYTDEEFTIFEVSTGWQNLYKELQEINEDFFMEFTGYGELFSEPEHDIYHVVIQNNEVKMINITSHLAHDNSPDVMKDKQKIVFSSERNANEDIYGMHVDGSQVIRLTDHISKETSPVFSPDGEKIAFVSNRDGNEEVYVMYSDGTQQTRLTSHPASDIAPSWSPDGQSLAFASNRDGNWRIYRMNSDGSEQRFLTENGNCSEPAFSPDGISLAYACDDDGDGLLDIFTMHFDGTMQTKITQDASSNYAPAWSADGKSIFFTSRQQEEFVYKMKNDGSQQVKLIRGSHPMPWN